MMMVMPRAKTATDETSSQTVLLQQMSVKSLSTLQSENLKHNIKSDYPYRYSGNLVGDQNSLQECMLVQLLVDYFNSSDTTTYSSGLATTIATTTDNTENIFARTSAGCMVAGRHAVRVACVACTNFDLKKLILGAKTSETLITILELAGFGSVAARLDHLKKITDEDPEDLSLDVESLRSSILFMSEHRQMPRPQIMASSTGLVYLRWIIGEDEGVLGMEFAPSRMIRFTAILHASDLNPKRSSVSGFLSCNDMINAVRPFIDKLVRQ